MNNVHSSETAKSTTLAKMEHSLKGSIVMFSTLLWTMSEPTFKQLKQTVSPIVVLNDDPFVSTIYASLIPKHASI